MDSTLGIINFYEKKQKKLLFFSGVRMYKKDKDEISEAPTFKGTGIINVPLDYVIQYTSSMAFKSEYDKMFESGTIHYVFHKYAHYYIKIVNLKTDHVCSKTNPLEFFYIELELLKDFYGLFISSLFMLFLKKKIVFIIY